MVMLGCRSFANENTSLRKVFLYQRLTVRGEEGWRKGRTRTSLDVVASCFIFFTAMS
jgi:hypothetical protein